MSLNKSRPVSEAARRAAKKYSQSTKGRATKRAWRSRNRSKIRAWKRKWASSPNGRRQAREWGRKTPGSMFDLYRRSAHKRGIVFRLKKDWFVSMLAKSCAYCGAEPPPDTHRHGLDRVDNSVGYVEGNLVTCCFPCNQMKGRRSAPEFIQHVTSIVNFQRKEATRGTS